MHVSMHNWMRAEPIEVTIARLAQVRLRRASRSAASRSATTRKHVRKLLQDHGLTLLGVGDADARPTATCCAKDEAQRATSVAVRQATASRW